MVSVSSGLNRGLVSWSLLDFEVGTSWLWLPSYVVITAFGSCDSSPRVLSLGIQGLCTCSIPTKSQRNITKDDISHIPNPVPKGIKTLCTNQTTSPWRQRLNCYSYKWYWTTSFACVCSLAKKEVCGYTNLGFGFPLATFCPYLGHI